MARQDPLFVLVRSMSRREKQHFKREASAQSEHARYVELFDAIAKHSKQSDAAIKERLEDEWSSKQLKPLKAYLFKALSRSLLQYLEGTVPSDEAQFLLRQTTLLKDRGLQHRALKALDRVERLAGESHRSDLLWQALELRRILLANRRDKLYRRENLHGALEGMEAAALDLLEYSRALKLYYRVWEGNWRRSREARSALLEALEAPEHKAMAHSANANVRLYHMLAWSHYQILESNLEASEALQRKVLDLFVEKPGLLEEHPQFQLSTAYNLANRMFMRHELKGIPPLVERVRHTPAPNPRLQTKQAECFAAHAFQYAALTGQDLEGSHWAGAPMAEANAPLPFAVSHRIDVTMKRGLYHWCRGRADEAIDALLENDRHPDLRRMPVHFAIGRMALLLAHVDMGNLDFAAERAQAIGRQYRNKAFEHAFEAPMYKFLERYGKRPQGEELQKLVDACGKALVEGRRISDYRLFLPLDEWLQSKAEKASFPAVLHQSGKGWPRIPGKE